MTSYRSLLSRYLEENQITQAEFAARARVSQVQISRYVTGERFPKEATALRIERASLGKVSIKVWKKEREHRAYRKAAETDPVLAAAE